MKVDTASQVISFAGELEEKAAHFYQDLAGRYQEHKEIFLSMVGESYKNKLNVQRVYQETISDALEAAFCFQGLDTDDYSIEIGLSPNESLAEILERALDIEEKAGKFYSDAAQKSKGLLADIPRVLERIAKKREDRKERLRSLF